MNLIEYPKEGILSKEIFKNNNADTTLFCLASGAGMSEHTSTKEGFVYVLEGEGSFNLEGKNIKMKQGVFIYMNKNAVHSLKAKDKMAFLLTLINNLEAK